MLVALLAFAILKAEAESPDRAMSPLGTRSPTPVSPSSTVSFSGGAPVVVRSPVVTPTSPIGSSTVSFSGGRSVPVSRQSSVAAANSAANQSACCPHCGK